MRFSKEVSVAAGAQFDGTELRLFPVGTEPNVQFRCTELNLRMGAESKTYTIAKVSADGNSYAIHARTASTDTAVILTGDSMNVLLGPGDRMAITTSGATSAIFAKAYFEHLS